MCIFIVTALCVFIINTHTTFFCGIFVTSVLRFYDKYAPLRSCMESLSHPHCAFMINTHTAALRGIFVTAASRIYDKNAHVRSHAESWSRPQMRIHDIRFRVESLSRPQLRIYDYFVEFFLCCCKFKMAAILMTSYLGFATFSEVPPNILTYIQYNKNIYHSGLLY